MIGQSIGGRYQVEGLLGAGGMGAVFAALDSRTHARVAVKMLLPELVQDEHARRRFEREIRAASACSRGGVVAVLEFDVDAASGPYMVMERLDGESLASRLGRAGAMEPRAAAAMAASVLETLSLVHAMGVVHRDIKPANLFLVPDGHGHEVVKLLDFGLARVFDPTSQTMLTMAGSVLGTPRYMPPEQLHSASEADACSDVYAVGAILYAAVSGKPPYFGHSAEQVLAALLAGPPEPLADIAPRVSHELCEVVGAAMARDRSRRFSSAAAFRAALLEAARLSDDDSAELFPSPSTIAFSLDALRTMADVPLGAEGPTLVSSPVGVAPVPTTPPTVAMTSVPMPPAVAARRRIPAWVVVGALGAVGLACAGVLLATLVLVRDVASDPVTAAVTGWSALSSFSPGELAAASEMNARLARARALLAAGDTTGARSVLESILVLGGGDLSRPGPVGRAMNEAELALGDVEASTISVAPDLNEAASRMMEANTRYARISYRHPDLFRCARIRTAAAARLASPVAHRQFDPLDRRIAAGIESSYDEVARGQIEVLERLPALPADACADELARLRASLGARVDAGGAL